MSKITKRTKVLQFIGLGWYIAGSILLGALAGFWLDQKIDSITFPLFGLLGLLLGIMTSFYGMYVMIFRFLKEEKLDKD